MLIDTHMHVFPDALAGKALPRMAQVAQAPYHTDGTVADTCAKMDAWGVDKGVFLHIATRPGQHKVNDFAAAIQNGRIICFGSVHPKDPEASKEMERIKALGLRGLKFHFDYQEVMIDDPAVLPLMEQAAQMGLPVAIHAGWDPYSPNLVHAPVKSIAALAQKVPGLKLIAAHMGGMRREQEVLDHLAGLPNVYLDTAMAAVYCQKDMFCALIEKHGYEKVFFATDCPWDTVPHALDYLQNAGLSAQQVQAILWQNAANVLGL